MKRATGFFRRSLWSILSISISLLFIGTCAIIYLESRLPDVETLRDVQFQVPLRIYTADNKLLAEYGEKRRIPIRYEQIPKSLILALLATEDRRFFEHPGVDLFGLMRAAIHLLRTGQKSQGGSTITMQVARNYFLNKKKTYIRKINEILLAIRIDHNFSKEKILELYFNKIYFGNRAYGVAAAAQVYYGQSLRDLSLAQMAMLAGLPKAPSAINPLANSVAALKRRNHVLLRMYEEGHIDVTKYNQSRSTPLTAVYHGLRLSVDAPYVAELIRHKLVTRFGKEAYTRGIRVYTTVVSTRQNAANQALRKVLIAYDRRHGYRGSVKNVGDPQSRAIGDWVELLKKMPTISQLQPAIVVEISYRSARALLKTGEIIEIPWQGIAWARKSQRKGLVGVAPQRARDVLKNGDVIYIANEKENWRLAQVPQIEGALVSLNPRNGAIESLIGGFAFNKSKFNRAVQAARQPGSSFKPFIYAAALNKGFTLATLVNDAPVVRDDPSLENLWRPENDTRRFYGPTRLREGFIHSRNLVSIRILESIGIPYTIDYLASLGFDKEKLPNALSLALGSLNITPLELAAKYATFANGGYKITPHLISYIMDTNDNIIVEAQPAIICDDCNIGNNPEENVKKPFAVYAPRVINPQVNYLINLALRDVVKHGTGKRARVLKRQDLAGKTGTTNEQNDAWFAGFNGNVVTVAWMGYDQPASLHEYASQSVLPMWIDYMKRVLKGQPETTLVAPLGLVTIRIDPKTGLLAYAGQKNSIFETFRSQYAPHQFAPREEKTRELQGADESAAPLF